MKPRIIIVILALALLPACTTTIHPIDPRPAVASFDGNVRDSGIIELTATGALITAHARDRYNGLIAKFGLDPIVSGLIEEDFGITEAPIELTTKYQRGPLYIISKHGIAKFAELNRMLRLLNPPLPSK